MTENNKLLSKAELQKRLHDHSGLLGAIDASRFKTGVLDVDLLRSALGNRFEGLDDCEVVAVKFSAITMNFVNKKNEPVFEVTTSNGVQIGSFFPGTFKSLFV